MLSIQTIHAFKQTHHGAVSPCEITDLGHTHYTRNGSFPVPLDLVRGRSCATGVPPKITDLTSHLQLHLKPSPTTPPTQLKILTYTHFRLYSETGGYATTRSTGLVDLLQGSTIDLVYNTLDRNPGP